MNNNLRVVIFILIIIGAYWIIHQRNMISSYQLALREANDNIEQCNYNIEDAKNYAWSSYDEMGDVLDNLSTVDKISQPYN